MADPAGHRGAEQPPADAEGPGRSGTASTVPGPLRKGANGITWDERFRSGAGFAGASGFVEALSRLGLLDSLKTQPVLDLGCGGGKSAISLERAGLAVVGIDVSVEGITALLQARTKAGLPSIGEPVPNDRSVSGIRIIQSDARHLPLREGSFHCVVASHILPEFDDRGMHLVIAEAARVLARGGVMAFESLGRGDLREAKRKGEYRFMTAQEMLTVIGAHALEPLEYAEDRIPVFYNGQSLERVYIHGVCRKR